MIVIRDVEVLKGYGLCLWLGRAVNRSCGFLIVYG
jgi:hypothetical protein